MIRLIRTAPISFCFILLWLWMIVIEWLYAMRCRLQKGRTSSQPADGVFARIFLVDLMTVENVCVCVTSR
jgi:hypothetical protein